MPSSSPLLIDLSGVARLADVRRPVASMWRSRFATAPDPFPRPIAQKAGHELFDALTVAQWLARTEHGNNRDVIADAAASAVPDEFEIADHAHVATVDALLALRAATSQPVGGTTPSELRERALSIDPDDAFLVNEVTMACPAWAEWADLLADAAYSPVQASRLLELRHATTMASSGSRGPLTSEAAALLVEMTAALAEDEGTDIVTGPGIGPSLAASFFERAGGASELVTGSTFEARSIRRRLLADGSQIPSSDAASGRGRLTVARLPTASATSASDVLSFVNELVLEMRTHDSAVILAPAAVLTEHIGATEGLTRTDILRSGRVRAIVKLPTGLVSSAPREALALWVLGSQAGDVPIAERVTAVADLSDVTLTAAACADLTSDIVAAMGALRDVHAHAFRFTRLVRTTSLLASRSSLVSGSRRSTAPIPRAKDLPALLDQARAALGDDAPTATPSTSPAPSLAAARVDMLIAGKHLRVLPGTQLDVNDLAGGSGLATVHAEDLDDPARIGRRRVDQLAFASHHPSARLTVAGDIIFRTSPTPRAWVDPDGSKVVVRPARVLRINPADPGGLIPELLAADIAAARPGVGAWRRWMMRRVAPANMSPLRDALAEVASRRAVLTQRLEALDKYEGLLTAGIVSGVVTLPNLVAESAPDPQ